MNEQQISVFFVKKCETLGLFYIFFTFYPMFSSTVEVEICLHKIAQTACKIIQNNDSKSCILNLQKHEIQRSEEVNDSFFGQ